MTIDANHLRLGANMAVDGDQLTFADVGARVKKTTGTVSNGYVSFDTELSDNAAIFDIGQPTRLTAPSDGVYAVGATYARMEGGGSYSRVQLVKNGSSFATNQINIASLVILSVHDVIRLSAGDYVEVYADGSTLSTANEKIEFYMQKIA
jgi:hypothetical protein